MTQGLLIIDVQNDFCPGGALAVPEGDKIIAILNRYIKVFSENKLPIFASRDWHPPKTTHFKESGGKWPAHCVQDTAGARFHPILKLPENAMILSKGMDPDKDSYSAFQAVDSKQNDFLTLLKSFEVKELLVGGLATDYCVKWSVLDALNFGFRVYLLMDGIKGVNLNPRDAEVSIEEMINLGAKKITFEKLLKIVSR